MLALLATHRSGTLSREKLIGYLWPDATQERARRLLSDAVYRINAALGRDVLVSAGDDLRLNPAMVSSDVGAFHDALDAQDYRTAVDAYAGPLLDGFYLPGSETFEEWLEVERERYRRNYLHALERLAEQELADGHVAAAVRTLRDLHTAEPLSSRVALLLMSALDRADDPGAALQLAQAHGTLLQRELGVEPPAEFHAFVEALRSRRHVAPAAPSFAGVDVSSATGSASLPAIAPMHSHPSDTAAAASARRLRPKRVARPRVIAAILLVTAAAAAAGILRRNAGSDQAPSIAVLPFADLTPDGTNTYFADGITEELIATLSRVPGLQVAARTSSFAFKGRAAHVSDIARQLDVRTVLEGSVRRADGRIKISVQLVNAVDGYEIWSQTYDRRDTDVLAVQEDIARRIVAQLEGTLIPTAPRAALAAIDPVAYDRYLRGRFLWHRRGRDDLQQAIAHFESAVAREPQVARFWAGLADAFAICGFYDYLPPHEAFEDARRAAARARDLEPRNAAAHATLGYVALYHDWDFPAAEENFRRAIALDSGYSTAYQWYGNLLTAAGRFAEAEAAMQQARLLDPLSLIANAANGWTSYYARAFTTAEAQLQQTVELDSTFHLASLWRGMALEALGRYDEMNAAYAQALRHSDGSVLHHAAVARGHALAGDTARARAILRELIADTSTYAPPYELAKVHLALGEHEAALDRLEQAVAHRAHSIAFTHVDPQLDALRSAPRFAAIAAQVRRQSQRP